MKIFPVIPLILLVTLLNAQEAVNEHLKGDWNDVKTALINDPDGYTNIRNEPGTTSEIIDKLYEGEFFRYWPNTESNWLVVYKFDRLYGYVHKSRILDLDDIEDSEFRQLCLETFQKELELAPDLYDRNYRPTPEESKEIRDFHELKYYQVLPRFVEYCTKTKDEELLTLFFKTVNAWPDDETPDFYLGKLFLAEPDWINKMVRSKPEGNMDALVWGFKNVIYNKEGDFTYHIGLIKAFWYDEE